MKTIRCAIYTRKSSEEGLEQDFNSLDAQHAACSAYVASQASEGWILVHKHYDDGGLSGGTLARPALQQLLADIGDRKIDIVVVYKVDRLTRSLLDFARLVETFDKAGTSFVSVTQSFNTTNSMGRLTLNMLLSFAQFEREVTAERIRDKVAASKQRGMWMGGTPPLGYEPSGRSLSIVEPHAELIRLIFSTYLELGTVRLLKNELDRRRIVKPVRMSLTGRSRGGGAFSRGELNAILANPIYAGRIRHRKAIHEGLHEAIIDKDMWERVQHQLADNRQGTRHVRVVVHPSPLAGKLFGPRGEKLVVSHASKGPRRYRYYVSRDLQHEGRQEEPDGIRIPAPEIETLVSTRLAELFGDPLDLISRIVGPLPSFDKSLLTRAEALAALLRDSDTTVLADLITDIVQRIDVAKDSVILKLDSAALARRLEIDQTPARASVKIIINASLQRSGHVMRLILPNATSPQHRIDESLLRAIANGHRWWQQLIADPKLCVAEIAADEGLSPSWVSRLLKLAFLDPVIIEQVLAGRVPLTFTIETLKPQDAVPALWSDQRARHRIAAL